ncbi:hypothetical protein PVK06_004647 [Gossypium arboreum]|uniref:Uncharacterized protein n=1 Tax=Gossypium arboreum TaxID=29729 RepID=A0ABR0QSL4_GOSAR|nr:hypothetical protein PVK06_004647 [Gossypium arboreum]
MKSQLESTTFFCISNYPKKVSKMFSLKNIPSTSSILSTYTTFTASAMLIRSVATEVQAIINQLIPEQLRNLLLSKLGGLYSNPSSQMTLLIND